MPRPRAIQAAEAPLWLAVLLDYSFSDKSAQRSALPILMTYRKRGYLRYCWCGLKNMFQPRNGGRYKRACGSVGNRAPLRAGTCRGELRLPLQ